MNNNNNNNDEYENLMFVDFLHTHIHTLIHTYMSYCTHILQWHFFQEKISICNHAKNDWEILLSDICIEWLMLYKNEDH